MRGEPMDISRHIWETKYRNLEAGAAELTIMDTWRRVARALAAVEPVDPLGWEERFYRILRDYRFLPAGRIQAGAGAGHDVTLFNCFVMGPVEDSIPGIFRALQEAAITMQKGGGIGVDFSTLRPSGTKARETGSIASGPLSFMHIWDSMCGTILSTGSRRGAMMATLRCDHPDIEEFVAAKRNPGQLRRFNLSVLVTDTFMTAVRGDAEWPLVFPAAAFEGGSETIDRGWSNARGHVP
jgi:ribonucleoside-diphosphate reductase alpha chain